MADFTQIPLRRGERILVEMVVSYDETAQTGSILATVAGATGGGTYVPRASICAFVVPVFKKGDKVGTIDGPAVVVGPVEDLVVVRFPDGSTAVYRAVHVAPLRDPIPETAEVPGVAEPPPAPFPAEHPARGPDIEF